MANQPKTSVVFKHNGRGSSQRQSKKAVSTEELAVIVAAAVATALKNNK